MSCIFECGNAKEIKEFLHGENFSLRTNFKEQNKIYDFQTTLNIVKTFRSILILFQELT